MESNRQKKIGGLLQQDLVDVLQGAARGGMQGVIISVSKVKVTVDLSIAKVYLSVFPNDKAQELLEGIRSRASLLNKGVKGEQQVDPNMAIRLLQEIEKLQEDVKEMVDIS